MHPVADDNPLLIPHKLPFVFSATTGGYARLWLSNLVLSVLTLGIYSAWAKVRTLKYLYGHTQVAGGRFGYHASPIAILKGRALMVGLFVLWQLSAEFSPVLQGLLGAGAAALAPWLAVQAMRFRLANTSWSGMRLHFDGQTGAAYRTFFKSWLTLLLSLGLLWPLATLQKQRYLLPHSRLGQARLAIEPCVRKLYLAGFGSLFVAVLYGVGFGGLGGLIWYAGNVIDLPAWVNGHFGPGSMRVIDGFFSGMLGVLWLLATLAYSRMAIQRVLLNHTSLMVDEVAHRLRLTLPSRSLFALHFSNTVALAFSLGLAWPWVRIRTLRATFGQLTLQGGADLAQLYTQGQSQHDARGDELAELLALDLGW